MDHRMVDVDRTSIGPLWIRRQLFEHSVAVPLLTSSTASQIDFPRLAAELCAANVTPASLPPRVTYDSWVAAAGLHARLDSSEHAGLIIEALETNAPDAFVRANDPEKLAPGKQLNYRQLLIPVPELLAFIKLHAAATISSRFRESQADAVWPDPDPHNSTTLSPTASPASPSHPSFSLSASISRNSTSAASPQSPSLPPQTHLYASTPSLSPASPRMPQQPHAQPHTQSPNSAPQHAAAPPTSPTIDSVVRKKTPTHLGAALHTQSAIIASVQHAFQRETRLVVSNLKPLLYIIASAYGVAPQFTSEPDLLSSESPGPMASGGGGGSGGSPSPGGGTAIAVESGTLARDASGGKLRRAHSHGSGSDAMMSDEHVKNAVKNIPITRHMFEHLSFLLTTICDPEGTYRSISHIVPQWREWSNTTKIPLGELVDILSTAITTVPLQREITGSTDVAEIRDLDRKTILRSAIPNTNAGDTGYPHGKEIRISNCSESHFYLLSSLGRVSLIASRDCTLFVGACVSVSLINCVNVRVHAIARTCRVTNSFDTHLYICTNRYPQIVGENRGLVFAPYNAAHTREELDKYLAAVGVDPNANVWNKFHRPAYRAGSAMDRKDPDLTAAVATVLQPELFLPFAVPVRPSSPSQPSPEDTERMQSEGDEEGERDSSSRALFSIPVPLPPAYQEQLLKKSSELGRVRKEIRTCDKLALLADAVNQAGTTRAEDPSTGGKDVAMSDSTAATTSPNKHNASPEDGPNNIIHVKRGLAQSMVQERFREWLNNSGRIKQIHDLVRLDQES